MPMKMARYPIDWLTLVREIKDACNWECQNCDQQCRKPGEPYDTMRRTLTVAHWDHIYDQPVAFVVCLCCPCHLRHDAPVAWTMRRRYIRQRQRQAGQLTLEL